MKKLFENWRKHTNEAVYEPGRAVADIDTGEEHLSPEEVAEEDVRDLAEKFNVEAFVETASDGNTAILVFHQNGEPTAYNDTEEMYQDLARRQEMNEGMDDFEQDLYPGADERGDPDNWEHSYDDDELSFDDTNKFVKAYNMISDAVESETLPESVEDAVFDMLGKLGINL